MATGAIRPEQRLLAPEDLHLEKRIPVRFRLTIRVPWKIERNQPPRGFRKGKGGLDPAQDTLSRCSLP
jgi:hypothetical protein